MTKTPSAEELEQWFATLSDDLLERYVTRWDGYHLRVERRDGRDGIPWDDLQAIKNQICGPEELLVEFYPPASQMVNEIPARHLWAIGGSLEEFGHYRHPS